MTNEVKELTYPIQLDAADTAHWFAARASADALQQTMDQAFMAAHAANAAQVRSNQQWWKEAAKKYGFDPEVIHSIRMNADGTAEILKAPQPTTAPVPQG